MLSFLHIRMELELVSLVSHSKVALSDLVPARLEGHLVASEPALEAHHSGAMDSCTVDVVVDVAAQVDVVAFVGCLDLAAFLAGRGLVRKDCQYTQESRAGCLIFSKQL